MSTQDQDKQRSELLKKQLTQMNQDFQFMKKGKEEWKKQLEARFQDIEKKIQNSKIFIANEAKKTNDTLLAFQHKFQNQLKNTKIELNNNISKLSKETDERFDEKKKQIDNLNKKLTQQTKSRNTQFEEGIKETREKFDKANQGLEKEKQARLRNEKQNMSKINESISTINQNIKDERDQRNTKLGDLRKNTDHELTTQKKFNQQFQGKTSKDFNESLSALRNQMEQRFSSKDEIVSSLSSIVKTLQNTLRHPN